jgi:hypothetical protein
MLWKVQVFKGDTLEELLAMGYEEDEIDEGECEDFEVSVIREDNAFGQKSWGWGGDNKIIIDVDSLEFAERVAKLLCEALNKESER